MAKRSANDSLDNLKRLIDGNNQIAVGLQVKLLRHVNAAIKKTKPSNPAKEKNLGSSQFEKKMQVSDEMCEFAKWEKGCLKSRVEVTNAIWGYVTENKLKSEQNKRICTLNDTLKALLKVQTDTIMYPQIQKYIGQHLKKAEPPVQE